MAAVFIQGASRGIGLEFVKMLSSRPGVEVIGGCRDPEAARQRNCNLPNVRFVECDVTREEDLQNTSTFIKENYGKLDLAVNVSGILHPSGRGETRLQDVGFQALEETFRVNTFGPLMMARYFSPLLQLGSGRIGSQSEDVKQGHTGVLAHISARVGSISDNRLGGWYSYRMSKAALNMANKNLSVELGRGKKKVVCLCLHPGTTDTELSRPYQKGVPRDKLFSTEFSVCRMLEVLDSASMKDTGKFFAWDGQEIPF